MTSSILSPTITHHLFFCSEPQCSNQVSAYNDMCLECECEASTISECPGCGDVTANGYCYDCWQERFGMDEEPVSWYKPICMGCDNAYARDGGEYCDDCANRHKYPFRYVCSRCDETFRMAKMASTDEPICGECHLEAADIVQTWWRSVREPKALTPIRIPKLPCADCGSVPPDGHFPCYRDDDPLCAQCGETTCLECGNRFVAEALNTLALCRPCKQMLDETKRYCQWCDGYYNLKLGDAERVQCYDCEKYSCTCDDSGRMCNFCAEEYKEPCRGCGVYSDLWADDTYCRKCYVVRYGYEFPPKTVPPIMNPENVCEECGMESLTDCDCKVEPERKPRGCCGC